MVIMLRLFEVLKIIADSPVALDYKYPDNIYNKLIFSEQVPRGTYINILIKSP